MGLAFCGQASCVASSGHFDWPDDDGFGGQADVSGLDFLCNRRRRWLASGRAHCGAGCGGGSGFRWVSYANPPYGTWRVVRPLFRSQINKSLLVLFFRKELLVLNFLGPDWIFEAGDEGGVGSEGFEAWDDGSGGSGGFELVFREGQGLFGLQDEAALAAAG